MSLGVVEVVVLLGIFLAIFGVGRLGEVGGIAGATIREFRRHVAAQSTPPDVPALPGVARHEMLPRDTG